MVNFPDSNNSIPLTKQKITGTWIIAERIKFSETQKYQDGMQYLAKKRMLLHFRCKESKQLETGKIIMGRTMIGFHMLIEFENNKLLISFFFHFFRTIH